MRSSANKKPLPSMATPNARSNQSIRTPFLLEHSKKMTLKLQFLKQKISQQKLTQQRNEKLAPAISDISPFLRRLGLTQYEQRLITQGLDSLEILREVKQSELQEIGVLKGHALKIMVALKKESQVAVGKMPKDQPQKQEKIPAKEYEHSQTESFPLQHQFKAFCLFCYRRSDTQFCGGSCEKNYLQMFRKYEDNLQEARQKFIPKEAEIVEEGLKVEQNIEGQDFINEFLRLSPNIEGLDAEQYNAALSALK